MGHKFSRAKVQSERGLSQRQLKVGELVRHALAEIFLEGKFYTAEVPYQTVTITEVRMSPDLQNATVYIVPFGGEEGGKKLLSFLNEQQMYIRNQVAKAVHLKYIPKLFFRNDDTFEHAAKINTLLSSVETDLL